MKTNNLKWILYFSLVLIWGTSFILIKKGLEVFDPVQVGSLRIIITFLALLPFVYKRFKKITPKDWFILGIGGLLGSFFPAYLFAMAQTGLNPSLFFHYDAEQRMLFPYYEGFEEISLPK